MNIRTATRTRIAATAAVLAGVSLALTGCGNSTDGTYLYTDTSEEETIGKLVIDGSSVNYFKFDCPQDSPEAVVSEEPNAVGQLNDEGTSVMWASDDEHLGGEVVEGTMSFSAQEYGDKTRILISGEDEEFTFAPGDQEEALAAYSEKCSL